jgi:predicted metal-dependent HD superfamily phosphohydrolase
VTRDDDGAPAVRRLASRWPLEGGYGVRDLLLGAYADPRRGYHDLRHLEEVLDHLDVLLAEPDADTVGGDGEAVRLAAWFHDAVYDGAPDDEERSARLAEESLAAEGVAAEVVAEVARLVRLTATHDPGDGDLAGAVLSDADLAVLAAEPERYAEYVSGVRREYAHVPDDAFRHGRAEVLRGLLAAPALFRTATGRRLWERRARENVEVELADLEA